MTLVYPTDGEYPSPEVCLEYFRSVYKAFGIDAPEQDPDFVEMARELVPHGPDAQPREPHPEMG